MILGKDTEEYQVASELLDNPQALQGYWLSRRWNKRKLCLNHQLALHQIQHNHPDWVEEEKHRCASVRFPLFSQISAIFSWWKDVLTGHGACGCKYDSSIKTNQPSKSNPPNPDIPPVLPPCCAEPGRKPLTLIQKITLWRTDSYRQELVRRAQDKKENPPIKEECKPVMQIKLSNKNGLVIGVPVEIYPAMKLTLGQCRMIRTILLGDLNELWKAGLLNQPLNVEINFAPSSDDKSFCGSTEKYTIPSAR